MNSCCVLHKDELERRKKVNPNQKGFSVDVYQAVSYGQSIFENFMENL